jgi:hypothetical protein
LTKDLATEWTSETGIITGDVSIDLLNTFYTIWPYQKMIRDDSLTVFDFGPFVHGPLNVLPVPLNENNTESKLILLNYALTFDTIDAISFTENQITEIWLALQLLYGEEITNWYWQKTPVGFIGTIIYKDLNAYKFV